MKLIRTLGCLCLALMILVPASAQIKPKDLLSELNSGDDLKRNSALEYVKKYKPAFLVPSLNDKIRGAWSMKKKKRYMEALKLYPVNQVLPAWLEILKKERSYKTKKIIIDHISNTSDRRVVIPLVEELKNPHSIVRNSASIALKKLGDDRMFPYIFTMAESTNPIYRVYALEAMYYLYDRRMSILIQQLLGDSNKSVRYYALKCMERNHLRNNLLRIRAMALSDGNWEVRIKAIEVIRTFRDAGATYVLVKCLMDRNREIRYAAAKTLHDFRINSTAYAVSFQLSVESDGEIKKTLVEALERVRNGGGFRGLERVLLYDTSTQLRIKAAYTMGVIGNQGAVSILLRGLSDKDFKVRAEICNSLSKLRPSFVVMQRMMDIVSNDPERYVRTAALYGIKRYNDRRVLVFLFDLFAEEKDPVFREKLREIVRSFISR